jgi:hypothetical protein
MQYFTTTAVGPPAGYKGVGRFPGAAGSPRHVDTKAAGATLQDTQARAGCPAARLWLHARSARVQWLRVWWQQGWGVCCCNYVNTPGYHRS